MVTRNQYDQNLVYVQVSVGIHRVGVVITVDTTSIKKVAPLLPSTIYFQKRFGSLEKITYL
jgi:hypothetical protein